MTARILTICTVVALAGCGESAADATTAAATATAPGTAAAAEPASAAGTAEEAAPVAAGPGDASAGAEVYTTYCAACHQADGTGMGGMLAADFTSGGRLDKSDAELLGSIRDGFKGKVGQMPPWKGTLDEQQMADVLAYVRASYGE